jgi:glycine dehydrogenase subunit 1
MAYSALTQHDREEMLQTIGVSSVAELFADIPAHLREQASPQIGEAQSELTVRRAMTQLSRRNVSSDDAAIFLGAGSYDHYIPAVVPAIVQRGEFMTAYTPYQAEVSQGTLQVIYEFQTLLCQLTGMEMANASLYDGATALAEAVIMAMAVTKKNKVLLPRTVSPMYRRVVETYLQGLDVELVSIEYSDGATSLENLTSQLDSAVAAIVVQSPNFFGTVEDVKALAELAHQNGALLVQVFNPLSLGVLQTPGECDVDIAVAEGQPLGIGMSFGGPGVGLFCCRKNYARFAPGRLVGQTTDEQGRVGYTLTLQTREQHIRREKATSNICTNQALCALMASVYLAAMGPGGLREAAVQCHSKAQYLALKLAEVDGVKLLFSSPFFHEFVVQLPQPVEEVNAKLLEYSIVGGYDLARDYPELQNAMLLCCTEKRTRSELDSLVEALKQL